MPFEMPAPYALADWRRRVFSLYAQIRACDTPEAGWKLWLDTRSRLFRDHPMSPIAAEHRGDFDEIAAFPYDPALRFAVDLLATTGPEVTVDVGGDGQMRYRPIAKTRGLADRLGGELTAFWITGYGGGLFIPFQDASPQTYGGGRYLADAIKGSDLGLDDAGRLILDFNFAYNPSCALNPAYVCPLSPPENRLPVAIAAGETVP